MQPLYLSTLWMWTHHTFHTRAQSLCDQSWCHRGSCVCEKAPVMEALFNALSAFLRQFRAFLQEHLNTFGRRLARERWALHVVCVSPVASVRASLTDACLHAAYANHGDVLSHISVAYDDRDSDRSEYAPPLVDPGVTTPRDVTLDTSWATRTWDSALAMAAVSQTQAADYVALTNATPTYGMNGAPGFNLGTTNPDAALILQQLHANGGLVEANAAACVFSTEQQEEYLASLPLPAQQVAMRSRVAFPFTARGKIDDGCGSYGRQYRDRNDRPTKRPATWYADLASQYALVLRSTPPRGGEVDAVGTAVALERLADALRAAKMPANDDATALGATLDICARHVGPTAVATLRDCAAALFPLLVQADRAIGVEATKIYDAKLVLSMVVRRAVAAGITSYAAWGLREPDGSAVADHGLVHAAVMTLMTCHLPASDDGGGPVRFESPEYGAHLRALVRALVEAPLRLGPKVLFLCDTGADPNEDDLAAILLHVNVNLLLEGRLRL